MSNASNHSTGDTQHNVRGAALHGAFLAFSKPPAKPTPVSNTYTGRNNGALLAAAKVGSPRQAAAAAAGSPAPLSSNTPAVPEDHPDGKPSSSNMAARLAAARYSPLPPAPQAAANTSMMSEQHANERDVLPPSGSVGSALARLEPKKAHKPTDDAPIPPATSPVKTFEQTRSDTRTKPTAAVPLTIAQHSPPPVRSPKPQRTLKLPPAPVDNAPLARQRTRTPPPVKPKPKHPIELPRAQFTDGAPYFNTPQKDPIKSLPIKQKPVQLAALTTSTTPPPKPPPQRGSRQVRPKSEELKRVISTRRTVSTSMESDKGPSSPASFKSAKEVWDEEEKQKPSVPPPRRSNTRKLDTVSAAIKPLPSAPVPIASRRQNQFPSPMRSPAHYSPPRRPMSTSGTSPSSMYHNNYQRDSVRQITKHMTGESLSSAIVGAALASSRNVSPAPPQPITIEPLFPSRKQHHRHHSPFHRSPSPQKQSQPKVVGKMRTTMRKDPSSSEDEDQVERYKKKGTRIMGIKGRKHPNKHHEGMRKRWRDQITDRERKRYEGVWAANKGLHIPSTTADENDASQDVLNYAAQEIWLRSRLPVHVLEEVWDLVDGRACGRLKRDEFVVGLWLIDQRLKGRKLPVRVSESVWTSARGLGIKVKVRS